MSRSNRSSSSRHSSISRASFTSNPNFIPSKIVRSPAPSPRKRWLVNTTMRRDVHPMAINPALEYQTRWIPAHTPTVAPKPRSHPSYYQGFNSKEFKQNGLHNRDTSRYRGRFIICSLNPNTAATETY